MMTADELSEALAALGELLADRGQHFEVAIIGGGALAIVGLIDRATKDLDVVALVQEGHLGNAVPLPAELAEAVADVARVRTLNTDWLNSVAGPMLRFGLPEHFLERCIRRDFGALTVFFASRLDQIHFKLYAAVDDRPGGKHHRDLQLLVPTRAELLQALAWVRSHESSNALDPMLLDVLRSFGVTED